MTYRQPGSEPWDPRINPNNPDLAGRFGGLNIGAQAFVPNVNAPSFTPRFGQSPQYGQFAQPNPSMFHHGPPGHYIMPGQGYPMMQPQYHTPYQQQPPSHPFQPYQQMKQQQPVPQPTPLPVSVLESQMESSNSPTNAERATPSQPQVPMDSDQQVPELDPVESWEELADDSGQPNPLSVVKGKQVTLEETHGVTESPKIAASIDTKEVVPKGTIDGVAMDDEVADGIEVTVKDPIDQSGSEKKPSPPTERISKAAAKSAVPIKSKEDKEILNIVFIGHVDAGKSTIGGHILFLTGQVDKRTLERYEREAKEKNRESWYLSWALDTNAEERDKGITVEVGRAAFETEKRRFCILDAPGHAGYVPNMISGAAQADVGILVISARKGEFETGFEKRGQTREHAMLAKTVGVKHLVILVNKMDDPTVCWSEERFEECKTKLVPFLKKVGFNPKTDIFFIPVSGLLGTNLMVQGQDVCPWYSGPAFIPYLDSLPAMSREETGPFRMPIVDKYKDMGTIVLGKLESGAVGKGTQLLMMPNKVSVEVLTIMRGEDETSAAFAGDNIKLKLKGIEEEEISSGFVLCDPLTPCHVGTVFEAQIMIMEVKSIICAGYSAVLHIHSAVEEVHIKQLLAIIDKKTGKAATLKPRFVKQDQVAIAELQTDGPICLETFKEFPPMARFTLRDEGKTIAIGKVLKLLE